MEVRRVFVLKLKVLFTSPGQFYACVDVPGEQEVEVRLVAESMIIAIARALTLTAKQLGWPFESSTHSGVRVDSVIEAKAGGVVYV